MTRARTMWIAAVILCASLIPLLRAAPPQDARQSTPATSRTPDAAAARPAPPPAFASPDVLGDKRVTLRVYAPKADEVRLVGTDIPRNTQGIAMTKDDRGVWET